jgi:hypothetical protein
VRRTGTVDMLRPDGLEGRLVLAGRGRDLRTGAAGTARVVSEASVRAVVDFVQGRTLRELTTAPHRPALAGALEGTRVSSGFRRRLDEADPGLAAEHDLLYLLLDDLPVTTLVSGHAVGAGLASGAAAGPAAGSMAGRPLFLADQCAGFATGGTIMNGIERTGLPPVVTGPAAPPLACRRTPCGAPAGSTPSPQAGGAC